MHLGGKLVLSVILAGLVVSGCQSGSTSPQAAPGHSSPAPKSPEATPSPAKSRSIAVPAPVRTSDGLVAELAPTKTKKFALLGVTWDRTENDLDVTVEVRVRSAEGWSAWVPLEVDNDGGEAGRGGTEPWWVENADEVRARVTTASGASPTGVKVITVDPGDVDAPASADVPAFYSSSSTSSVVSVADGQTFTPKPTIRSRSSWNARAANGCDEDGYDTYGDTTLGVNLHHTAGTNSYSKSQSASIVKGIQKFHQSGRGWCDIAYNFLVDKYGQIFEGRFGGVDKPVRGSHSGNNTVNERTMGIALMGNLDKARPTSAMKTSAVKLAGWRLATYYKPAKGSVSIGSKTLQRISGHRNVVSTACPGKYGYSWLLASGGMRDRVSSYISNYQSKIKTAAQSLDGLTGSVTGSVKQGEIGGDTRRRTMFSRMNIFWLAPSASAFVVAGAAKTVHEKLGMQNGVLGFPMANMAASSISGLSVQPFQNGAIYQTATGTYGLYGDIYTKYVSASVGGPSGQLGVPKSGVVVSGTTKTVTFEHGTITQNGTAEPVVALSAPAEGAPSQLAPETAEPTPSASEEGVEPVSQAFPVLWLRRSGMISA
ncbi:N-acetylmuramoyl-L-alanine amidase [Aeromicrobium sp.]|uniref:N-acetylmuramoyl-L-alanine amidase n=1 Tax=Aeromicrobium sp. TaxID=1871063 RepID=UPI002FCC5043